MHANFGAILDACVLANYSVCDLFLRLAETPRLYVPHWSEEILEEVRRTHQKLQWPEKLTASWQKVVREYFPESMVKDYEVFIELAKNEPKDRHVVAAALKSNCEVIVTFNLRDFPRETLSGFGIRAEHPSEFLINLYNIDPGIFVTKLVGIASQRQIDLRLVIESLSRSLPAFTDFLSESIGIE